MLMLVPILLKENKIRCRSSKRMVEDVSWSQLQEMYKIDPSMAHL